MYPSCDVYHIVKISDSRSFLYFVANVVLFQVLSSEQRLDSPVFFGRQPRQVRTSSLVNKLSGKQRFDTTMDQAQQRKLIGLYVASLSSSDIYKFRYESLRLSYSIVGFVCPSEQRSSSCPGSASGSSRSLPAEALLRLVGSSITSSSSSPTPVSHTS